MDKFKELIKSNEFKASLWTIVSIIAMSLPFIIIFIVSLTQYSYITNGFWIAILLLTIILVVILAFSNVIYAKILGNYQNKEISKKECLNIFKKELLSPICLGTSIVVLLVVLDQLSKILAVKSLSLGDSVVFIKYLLNWNLAYNKGAAWSMCSEHTNILAIVSLLASLVIMYFMKDFNIKKKPLYSLGVSLMLGGTIGNMIDRFFSVEGVVDFIEFGFMDFPIFNLADTFLVVGTIALMASILFTDVIHSNKNKENIGETND